MSAAEEAREPIFTRNLHTQADVASARRKVMLQVEAGSLSPQVAGALQGLLSDASQHLDVYGGARKIVTLSGSSRFIDVMAVAAWHEERAGHVALSCHLLPTWYTAPDGTPVQPHHQAEAEGVDKSMDTLHLDKIDMSDELLVIDVDGYIGDSTRAEIAHAVRTGKLVRYLSKEDPEWFQRSNEIDPGSAA